ncbi:alpha/beta fold hydrolase, partial [Dactylosporangium siamense]
TLGINNIGIHDNFFDLGGHSLLATQVVARIRAAGHEISIADLFDHPTIAALATLARAATGRSTSTVDIREGTDGPPLFFVHSGTGGVTDYAALAGHFADGQRVIGLQSRGLVDDEEPLASVDEMARSYLEDVRRIRPAGPYLFAGWSMGGYVALEMARRAGGDVFLVGPPLHGLVPNRWRRRGRKAALRLVRALTDAIAGGTPLRPAAERELFEFWSVAEEAAAGVRDGDVRRLRAARIAILNTLASVDYRALLARRSIRHDGRVVLFLPEEDVPRTRAATLAQWRAVVPAALEVLDAPGTHFTLVRGDEGARFAGTWLSAELARRRDLD